MKTTIEQEILKRESEFQIRQDLMGEVSKQYCDRGDTLFSSSGVCFESGILHGVTHRDAVTSTCVTPVRALSVDSELEKFGRVTG